MGTELDAVSEISPVDAGMVMLADAGGRKPAEPVDRGDNVDPDPDTTLVTCGIDVLALGIVETVPFRGIIPKP